MSIIWDKPKPTLVPCFVCGESLDREFDNPVQPSEGVMFPTAGNYGSTFWDSMDGEEIIILICDECLTARKDRIARYSGRRPVICENTLVGWEKLSREPVPWFDGESREPELHIEPEELKNPPPSKNVTWNLEDESLAALRESLLATGRES